MSRIIITVRDGLIQDIITDDNELKAIVFDYDNLEDGAEAEEYNRWPVEVLRKYKMDQKYMKLTKEWDEFVYEIKKYTPNNE